tara:strand:- start:250 stop:837 length:588 start_codon:yes stop_codon:yes gene_type:complete
MDILFLIDFLNNLIDSNYILSIILYFIFLIIFFSFSLPGSPILLIISGYFFGFYIGFFINILSVVIGTLIFFIFAQSLFIKFFNKYFEYYSLKFTKIIKNSSYEYLILLRLLIGPPILVQNICISFLQISIIKLMITTFIGFSPLYILLSYLGDKISNLIELQQFNISEIFSLKFILIIIFFICILLLKIIFKKK